MFIDTAKIQDRLDLWLGPKRLLPVTKDTVGRIVDVFFEVVEREGIEGEGVNRAEFYRYTHDPSNLASFTVSGSVIRILLSADPFGQRVYVRGIDR